MIQKIVLFSTSFLLPGNRRWSSLGSSYQLSFADYGSWANSFLESDESHGNSDAVVWVLFFEDVFPPSFLSATISNPQPELDLKKTVDVLLHPIKCFLQETSRTIILAYSKGQLLTTPSLSRSKCYSLEEKASEILESQVLKMRDEFSNLYILNLDTQFSAVGVDSCFDPRNYYSVRCRLSSQGISLLAEELMLLLNGVNWGRKKILILDCDNTLWGGVLGEIGLSGIQIGQDGVGQAFRDFQHVIRSLSLQGVMLAIASKNNEADVLEVFEKHPSMVLKKEDFVSMKINWEEKFSNICSLAKDLNIGVESCVVWDDNPVERDMIRKALPGVTVIEPSAEVTSWPLQLRREHKFSQAKMTKDDFDKKRQYKARSQFEEEINHQMDKVNYLKTIGMKAKALWIDSTVIDRAQQLCLKTNQFNLRTVRHSKDSIERILKTSDSVGLVGHLADKFGDHGIVGLIIIGPTNRNDVRCLDTFLLSCRVIGRYFETWLLRHSTEIIRKSGAKYLVAEHVPTTKNQISSEFLARHGFEPVDSYASEIGNIDFDAIGFDRKKTLVLSLETTVKATAGVDTTEIFL